MEGHGESATRLTIGIIGTITWLVGLLLYLATY